MHIGPWGTSALQISSFAAAMIMTKPTLYSALKSVSHKAIFFMALVYGQVRIIQEGNVTTVVALDDGRLHIGSIETRGYVDMGKRTKLLARQCCP